jgi:glutamate carboxypeptidase
MTAAPDAVLADLRALVEAESPTERPELVDAAMDVAAARLAALGFAIRRIPGRDGFGGHLDATAPWGGAGPGVLVLSHLDTVHPVAAFGPQAFRIDGDFAIGPGALDMKGGVAILLQALREIAAADAPPPLPLRVLITSDEEVGSPTSRALIEAAAREAAYVLVTEPARAGGELVTGRRGVGRYVVQARGRPAHSGLAPQDGRSAIREIARRILEIEAMTDPARAINLNVGQVWGGVGANTVPEHAGALVDLRIDDPADAEELDARIKGLKPDDPEVALTVSGGINRPPFRKTREIAALFERARAIAAEIGFDLQDAHTGGGGDASFVAAIAPVLDGLGVEGAGAHTLEERVRIDAIPRRTALLRRLIETLA